MRPFDGSETSTYWNSPCLVDLNGDGRPDLIYGTSAGPLQYYVNGGPPADPVWTANTSLFGGVLDVGAASSPFFFDFDADGDLDLVSGSQLGDIKYYENVGTNAAPAWSRRPRLLRQHRSLDLLRHRARPARRRRSARRGRRRSLRQSLLPPQQRDRLRL